MRTIAILHIVIGFFVFGSQSSGQAFSSGSDGSYGSLVIASNTVLDIPSDGIFHCTSITISNGANLWFNRNTFNTPVYLLAKSNVVINGQIHISGGNNSGILAGRGGPGGFDGGFGAFQGFPGGSGQGPGAGAIPAVFGIPDP